MLSDVRHVETMRVYRVVEMLTARFLYAKAVNALGRVTSEGLQLSAVWTGTRKFDIQTPVRWRFGRNLAAAEQKLC